MVVKTLHHWFSRYGRMPSTSLKSKHQHPQQQQHLSTRMNRSFALLSTLLILLLLINESCSSEEEYSKKPTIEWKTRLGNGKIYGPSIRKGNGIVSSIDRTKLFVTVDDGTFCILNANSGSIMSKYTPPPVKEGWYTHSQSSVASSVKSGARFGHSYERYLVYAVIDIPPPTNHWVSGDDWYDDDTSASSDTSTTPPPNDVIPEKSRVIAMNTDGTNRWIYNLNGVIVGTPQFGRNGEILYVATNVNQKGYLYVLRDLGTFAELLHEYTSDINNRSGGGSYGKIDVVTTLEKDLIYWMESSGSSYISSSGNRNNDKGILNRMVVDENLKVTFSNMRDTSFGSSTALTLSKKDGTSFWTAGEKAIMQGWTTNDAFRKDQMWESYLDRSERDASMPLVNRAITISDESLLFIPSTATSFHCLDSTTGKQVWKVDNEKSVYVTEAKLSQDDVMVYSILHMDGTIIEQDARSGNVTWSVGCRTLFGGKYCQNSVEAEFSISTDNRHLYYGDIYGNIASLLLPPHPYTSNAPSSLLPPTKKPSITPVTMDPTTPSPTAHPTNEPTFTPSSIPSALPSRIPSGLPSKLPTTTPTYLPSGLPSTLPTTTPTYHPSAIPTILPTMIPSEKPSINPSDIPSETPISVTARARSNENGMFDPAAAISFNNMSNTIKWILVIGGIGSLAMFGGLYLLWTRMEIVEEHCEENETVEHYEENETVEHYEENEI